MMAKVIRSSGDDEVLWERGSVERLKELAVVVRSTPGSDSVGSFSFQTLNVSDLKMTALALFWPMIGLYPATCLL
jgi:hypothetical protein